MPATLSKLGDFARPFVLYFLLADLAEILREGKGEHSHSEVVYAIKWLAGGLPASVGRRKQAFSKKIVETQRGFVPSDKVKA